MGGVEGLVDEKFLWFCGFSHFFGRFLCDFAVWIVACGLRFIAKIWCNFSVFGYSELRLCGFHHLKNTQWVVWALMDPNNPLVLSVTSVSKLKYAFLAQNHEFKVTMLSMLILRFRQFFQAVLRFFQKFCAVLRFSRPLWHPRPMFRVHPELHPHAVKPNSSQRTDRIGLL